MTRGQIIFLILMICSATMIGAAMGVASNFDLLAQQSKLISNSAAVATAKQPDEINDNHENKSASPITEQINRSSQLMLVTNRDKEEIRKILLQLGMNEEEQAIDFISNFQRSHSLSVTGSLDAETLKLMIQQATYNKTSHSAATAAER